MNAMLEAEKTNLPLNHHRKGVLGLTQEQLAQEAGVPLSTLRYHEQNPKRRFDLQTAYKLLTAINRIRTERGMPGLGLRDIDWILRE